MIAIVLRQPCRNKYVCLFQVCDNMDLVLHTKRRALARRHVLSFVPLNIVPDDEHCQDIVTDDRRCIASHVNHQMNIPPSHTFHSLLLIFNASCPLC